MLCQETDYVLLDELLSDLDMKHPVAMVKHLRRITNELGKTIVIGMHGVCELEVRVETIGEHPIGIHFA